MHMIEHLREIGMIVGVTCMTKLYLRKSVLRVTSLCHAVQGVSDL